MSSHIPQWDTPATRHAIRVLLSTSHNIMFFLPSGNLHRFSFYTSFLVETCFLRTWQEHVFSWNAEIFAVFENQGREAAEVFMDDLICMGCHPDTFLHDIHRLLENPDINMTFPDLSQAINAAGFPGTI